MSQTAQTAADAAAAIGCDLTHIVKWLVFCGVTTGTHFPVLISGASRADERKLAALAAQLVVRELCKGRSACGKPQAMASRASNEGDVLSRTMFGHGASD